MKYHALFGIFEKAAKFACFEWKSVLGLTILAILADKFVKSFNFFASNKASIKPHL